MARCVLERRSIPPEVQDALIVRIGLPGVIELVVLVGFYQMIAGVIFAFDVPLPEGATPLSGLKTPDFSAKGTIFSLLTAKPRH